jgi:rhodanese-related sulfurtransferase
LHPASACVNTLGILHAVAPASVLRLARPSAFHRDTVTFQLIDVRESFEYEVSNLNGLNIPLSGILIEADKIAKDKPVIVQCRSGKRSAQAIMLLEQQGFDNLANLKGDFEKLFVNIREILVSARSLYSQSPLA